MLKRIRALARDKCGGTAIEYGLIAALVVLAMVSALGSLGGANGGLWNNILVKFQSAN
jgi:pilus assembly protein Flp/PilA